MGTLEGESRILRPTRSARNPETVAGPAEDDAGQPGVAAVDVAQGRTH